MTERDTVRDPTCALQENKSGDNQHRMPVELSQTTIPAQTLLKVKNPSQHEDDGDEARSSGSRQSQQEVFQVLHLCVWQRAGKSDEQQLVSDYMDTWTD